MWKFGNLWTSTGTSMTSNLTAVHDIHVLLVDHDSEGLINTAKLLETCQYRVTLAELASVAITMMLTGKTKFDIVMANINSPDLHGFKLLQQAVNMKIPIILMSVDDNTFMTLRAIEDGAFLCIKKPPTIEMIRCLWQHVVRERLRVDTPTAVNYGARGVEFREAILHEEDNLNHVGMCNMLFMTKESEKATKKMRGERGAIEEEYDSRNRMSINNKIKRKVCTEWTAELHEKFVNAVAQLGEGRCFPKEILELMDVPGLTRMQVASHLQKCRNNNWRSPHDRKSNPSIQDGSCDTNGSQYKSRRFGSMPRLGNTSYHPVQEANGVGRGSKIHFEAEVPNDGGTNISNSRHPYDDFFNFPEMDNLIQNFSGLPQGSTGIKISSSVGLHDNPIYHEQNSTVPSMDTKSQYSETSNFGSDESETKRH